MRRSNLIAALAAGILMHPTDEGSGSIPDPKDEGTAGDTGTGGTSTKVKRPDVEDEDITNDVLKDVVHNMGTMRANLATLREECDLNPGLREVLNSYCFSEGIDGPFTPDKIMEDIQTFADTLVVAARRTIALNLASGVRAPMKDKTRTVSISAPRAVRSIIGVEKSDKRAVNSWLNAE